MKYYLFSVNPDFKEVLKQLSRQRKILDEQALKLDDIYQKLNEIVNLKNQHREPEDAEEADISENFPVGTEEGLAAVEHQLQTGVVFKKLVCIC